MLNRIYTHLSDKNHLLWWSIATSLLLSLICCWHSFPNTDAYLYLSAAKAFNASGYDAAKAYYDWPFYPIFIAIIHQVTTLSYETSGHLIATVFFTLIVVGFMQITKELIGEQKILLMLGALTVLIHPTLNDSRDMFIRDYSYWAFLLLALAQLLKFSNTSSIISALNWHIFMVLATLFRIEGIVVWLGCSAILIFDRNITKDVFLKLYLPPVIVLLATTITLYLLNHPSLEHFARVDRLFIWSEKIALTKNSHIVDIANHFYEHVKFDVFFPSSYAHMIIYAGMTYYFFYKLIVISAPIILFFALLGFKPALASWKFRHKLILLTALTITFLTPALFFSSFAFVSYRYLIAFILILMLFSAYGIKRYFAYCQNQPLLKRRILISLAMLGLTYTALDGLISTGSQKFYLKEAGVWISQNIPQDKTIFINNRAAAYFADRFTTADDAILYIEDKKRNHYLSTHSIEIFNEKYDYIAINIKHRDQRLEMAMAPYQHKLLKSFANKKNDRINIYRWK